MKRIICKVCNDKLYNQYYPIKTEEEKNNFLNSNYIKLYEVVRHLERTAGEELGAVILKYDKKLKPCISRRNIQHNAEIIMERDRRIKHLENTVSELGFLAQKIMYREHENISIHELNLILSLKNSERHMVLSKLFIFIAFFITWKLTR